MKYSQTFRVGALVTTAIAVASIYTLVFAREDTESSTKFVRFNEKKTGEATLDTAIVTYRNKDGVTVHLVGAVHIGERSYYDALEKAFDTYDAVLYELVKEKGVDVKELQGKRRKSTGGAFDAVTILQRWLTDTLKLEFQLDRIDYTRDNFIHADLDLETFVSLQNERGESLLVLMLRAMKHSLERRSRGEKVKDVTLVDLVRIFLSKDRTREMKLVMARQMQDIEAQIAGIEGPNGSVILTERNKAAMRVLKKSLGSGKKNIGIFYGAAHMPDLETRLRGLGFKKTGTAWHVAWDMTESTAPSIPKKAKKPKKAPADAKNRPPVKSKPSQ